jgi:TPR repeat protein
MRLGEIYLRGEGVETNTDLARKWLSAAMTNGCPQATNLLSEIERGSATSR